MRPKEPTPKRSAAEQGQEFADVLKRLREESGTSRKEVVRGLRKLDLQVSESTIAKWEEGINRPRDYHVVAKLSDVLGLEKFSESRSRLFRLAGDWTERAEHREGLPGARCRRLVGRTELIDDVIEVLRSPRSLRIVVLAARAGYGKTEFVRYLSEKLSDWKDVADVVWLSLKRWEYDLTTGTMMAVDPAVEPNVPSILRWLTYRLGCRSESELASRLSSQPILIVLDNLETLPVADRGRALRELHRLLGNGPSRVIITTRFDLVAPYIYKPRFGGLSLSSTRDFLLEESSRLPRASLVSGLTPDVLKRVWELTDGMPLALHMVIGQMQHFDLRHIVANLERARARGHHLDFYRFMFQQAWQELSRPAAALLVYLGTATVTPQTVSQLLDLSPTPQLTFDGDVLSGALRELSYWFLVERSESAGNPGDITYDLHPLTRAFVLSPEIREEWERDFRLEVLRGEATKKHKQLIQELLGSPAPALRGAPVVSDVLARVIPECLQSMKYQMDAGDTTEVLWYWQWISGYLWLQGRYLDYIECDRWALVAAERLTIADRRRGQEMQGTLCAELAMAHIELGIFDVAERYAGRSEDIFRALGSPRDVAVAFRYQAYVRYGLDDLRAAEELCLQALSTLDLAEEEGTIEDSIITKFERTTTLDSFMNPENERRAERLRTPFHNLLGTIYTKEGKYSAARRELARALASARLMPRASRRYWIVPVLCSLGGFHEQRGDPTKAKAYFQKCVDMTQDGIATAVRAEALLRLAHLLVSDEEFERAERLGLEAMRLHGAMGKYDGERQTLRFLEMLEQARSGKTPRATSS